ncbi:LuxR C-terminal-related transcriptional regulator [Citrobacter rodentium]|jgi:Response regulator containing a CheY-like receiver domain and an HTH DNA-binding domain|uniref:LuxR-family transcriptional regulator n=2 Tax=Citrobacter rodentium TaxID=67825 RepID=D2TLZ1_CITRI|nr:LuxR family transcriptional regulator [Citrobacter rodentium]KIQ50754.1 hypothetical protein TA05_14005 [Citrobacter rodentium]QBY28371.1 LuxR family transcriptional regulator [Citrobacter rodentium]UHO29755.1 LuxR C-terminal-related transcriptional regulator [Citrobacter rodentium NBRC 105723 = DSM 16636]CBG88568.1 putative LuxR-family transcriptional regulator [Citrobacter rodentium ICC168]HAT8012707.1 hypothetical protein [Citrobacter rodentium NBRC 105723 = DSM 16636]
MNIVIRSDDTYYKMGLIALLTNFLHNTCQQRTLTFADYQAENISDAQIIITVLRPGEMYLCHPELLNVAPKLMVGIVETEHMPARSALPDCLKQIVLIPQDATVAEISSVIKYHWLRKQNEEPVRGEQDCAGCTHRMFSERQGRMLELLLAGLSSRQVGEQMNIAQKTVLAHRQALLHKFRLRTNCELMRFLLAMQQKKSTRLRGFLETGNEIEC